MNTRILTFSLILFGMLHLKAQPIDIGLTLGVMAYNGDLAPVSPFDMLQQIRPAVGIFGRTSFNQRFGAKVMINFGSVDGDDKRSTYPERGLNFKTSILEANITGEVSILRIRHSETSFTYPYVFGGVGIFHFNPKGRLDDGTLVELQPLGTEGQGLPGYSTKYQRTQINFPIGFGLKYILSDKWTVSFEAGARVLLTDYLDDVSATQLDYQTLYEGNGELAARLSNRSVNLTNNEPVDVSYRRGSPYRDWYYVIGIMVSHNFGDALRKAFHQKVPCYSGW